MTRIRAALGALLGAGLLLSPMALSAEPAQANELVTLEGSLAFTGVGETRLELLRVPEEGPVVLLWSGVVPRPGGFSVQVPANLGDAMLRAGADLAGDGIGPEDPQLDAPISLSIGDTSPPPMALTLIRFDLGDSP